MRFDFDGQVIANDANIPVCIGLHHHGEECTTPGYSLDELFTFARSSFLQQRVFAVKLLARILQQVQYFSLCSLRIQFLFFTCSRISFGVRIIFACDDSLF